MRKKGQAWAEYIVILAVVIIIAGIAMFLTGGFLGNSNAVTEHDSAAYWLSADVGIARYHVSSSMMQLVIKNNKGFKIAVTNITSNGIGSMNVPGGGNTLTLESGQSVAVNVTGVGCSAGAYSIPLRINYFDVQYGTHYSLDGEMPLVGTCMTAQKCSSNSDCGTETSTCSSYCNGNQACSYSIGSSTCNRTCSGGICQDCTPSCGTATCTSCGTSSFCSSGSCTACSSGTANCYNHATCDVNTKTDNNNCGSCGHACGTGQNCSAGSCVASGSVCGNGICEAGETVSSCPQDCCNATTCTAIGGTSCQSACSSICSNWRSTCNSSVTGGTACSNSTGGTSGALNYQTTCCNGAIASCPTNSTCPHTGAWCNGTTQNCSADTLLSNCTMLCSGGVCASSCTPTCQQTCTTCPTGQTCSGGICTITPVCNSDCTFGSTTACNSSCSGNCTGWQSVCSGLAKGTLQCSGNSQFSCCNGTLSACGTSSYCVANIGCTNCSAGTANCYNHATCDVNTSADPNNCGGCGNVCALGVCSGGACTPVASCNSDCTFGSTGICNSSCSGNCTNFHQACGTIALNVKACSNSTGGTSGALNYQTTCCNGALTTCGTTNCPLQSCSVNTEYDYPANCNNTCSGTPGSCQNCTCTATTKSCNTTTCTASSTCSGNTETDYSAGTFNNGCNGNTCAASYSCPFTTKPCTVTCSAHSTCNGNTEYDYSGGTFNSGCSGSICSTSYSCPYTTKPCTVTCPASTTCSGGTVTTYSGGTFNSGCSGSVCSTSYSCPYTTSSCNSGICCSSTACCTCYGTSSGTCSVGVCCDCGTKCNEGIDYECVSSCRTGVCPC